MQLSEMTVLLQGAGKMGMAMLEGWLKGGLKPQNAVIFAPRPSPRVMELKDMGASVNTTGGLAPDYIVLATKPQVMGQAWPEIAPHVPGDSAVISVAVGRTLAWLEELTGRDRPIVRAMPNTPAAIGKGVTGAIANEKASGPVREGADLLLRAVGEVVWIEDEGQMDALSAISGSGPAYVFHLVEAMAAAGVEHGLPEDLAMRLARQTVIGAGALLEQSDESAAQLRANVTSPGGTTQAALDILRRDEALTALMREAVANAIRRAGELAG